MTITVRVPLKVVNGAQLKAEIEAAAPGAFEGYSTGKAWPGMALLHFVDRTPQAVIDAAQVAYTAHDPAVKTPDQVEAEARASVKTALAAADFKALKAQIEGATSLAQLRPILLNLLLLEYRIAHAAGLVGSTSNPEA